MLIKYATGGTRHRRDRTKFLQLSLKTCHLSSSQDPANPDPRLRLKLLHCWWLLGRELPSSNSCGSVPILNVFFTEMLNLILCSEWVCAVSGLGLARPGHCPVSGKLLLGPSRAEERRYMRQAIRLHEIYTINRYEFGNWRLIPWLIECQSSLCWCEGEFKLVILPRWPGLGRETE